MSSEQYIEITEKEVIEDANASAPFIGIEDARSNSVTLARNVASVKCSSVRRVVTRPAYSGLVLSICIIVAN